MVFAFVVIFQILIERLVVIVGRGAGGAGGGAHPLDVAEQLERAGQLEDAAATYRAAIDGPYAAEPAAHAGLGGVLSQLGDLQGAVKAFKAALKVGGKPTYGIHFNIGLAYMQGGRLSGAVKHLKLAIKHNPEFREAHLKLASALKDKGDLDTAIHHLQQAIELEPANPNAYGYLGGLLNNAKRWQDAVAVYRRGLELAPKHAETRVALADTLSNLKRYTEAGEEYKKVIAQAQAEATAPAPREDDPTWSERSGHGCEFFAPGQPGAGHCRNPAASNEEGVGAAEACPTTCARELADEDAGARAADSLAEALGGAVAIGQSSCNWEGSRTELLPSLWRSVVAELQADEPSSLSPYRALYLPPPTGVIFETNNDSEGSSSASSSFLSTRELLAGIARSWAIMHAKQASKLGVPRWKDWWLSEERTSVVAAVASAEPLSLTHDADEQKRVRIGYISRRIEDYAGTHLMLPVYSAHNRSVVSVHVFARGRDDGSTHRAQVAKAADTFEDLSALPTASAAERIRNAVLDVLVDYDGAHDYNNMELLALRMAPVQCSWIGFPASTGAPFVDYLIADLVVAPPELVSPQLYSESMLYMPYSFTAAGYAGHQEVDATLTRLNLGLPEREFVMCSFNRLEKLDEPTFGLWLELLLRIPGSVLWIYEPDGDGDDATAEDLRTRSHLLATAAAAGISAGHRTETADSLSDHPSGARIRFAGRQPKAQHLGRLRQADLFLDGAQYSVAILSYSNHVVQTAKLLHLTSSHDNAAVTLMY